MIAASRCTVQRYRADSQLLGHRSVTELLTPEIVAEGEKYKCIATDALEYDTSRVWRIM
jgi:hypothetical protein